MRNSISAKNDVPIHRIVFNEITPQAIKDAVRHPMDIDESRITSYNVCYTKLLRIVDDERGIKDPRNMIGVRLEAEVHIVTASVTSIQNVVKCVNRASLSVDEYMLHSLAAAKAVMRPEERELGSVLLDLGGGSTDVLVIRITSYNVCYTKLLRPITVGSQTSDRASPDSRDR